MHKQSNSSIVLKHVLFIFCILIQLGNVFGQEKIRVLNADINMFNPKVSEARLLYGNVQIEHDGALLFCDTAQYFDKDNLAKAYGHVQINQNDTLNVYGDTIFYYGNSKEAEVFGNVKLIDDNAILRSPSLVYKLDSNIAYYDKGGFMYDSETGDTLISDRGVYYGKQSLMDFSGNVLYKSKDYTIVSDRMLYNSNDGRVTFKGPTTITTGDDEIYCENGWYDTRTDESSFSGNGKIVSDGQTITGDSISYNRAKGSGEMFGNVILIDTASDFAASGGYAKVNQNTGEYLLTDNPQFSKFNENDTLLMKADTLFAFVDTVSNQKMIRAYYNVRFIQQSLVGKCDSLYYNEQDSILQMFNEPILWQDSSQIFGDTIFLITYDGALQEMKVNNKAFIISMADTVGYDQISGKYINGYFKENSLKKVFVLGNGQTIYYAYSDEDGYIGMDRSVCSNIRIEFKEDEIEQIVFIEKPESVLYPLKDVKEDEKLLKGFRWMYDEKLKIQIEFESKD